jgi:predicted enzyme related to lactoylglutathione lyase
MALNVGWMTLDTPEPANLAPFWEHLLGRPRGDEDDQSVEFVPPGGGPRLLLWRSPDAKVVKNRMHLDLVPDDQEAEVARAIALGARRVDIGQGEEASHVVLADPEGNEFCVLRVKRDLIN